MDKIPLIKSTLVNAVANKSQHSARILHAEVVSSSPAINNSQKNQQQFNVELKIGQHNIATLSSHDLKPGSQIDVKILPGPELKIINSEQNIERNQASSNAPKIEALAQQVLADRVPKISQQDTATIVKQLSQQLSQQQPAQQPTSPSTQPPFEASLNNPLNNALSVGNKLYQSLQNLGLTESNLSQGIVATSTKIDSRKLLQQGLKNWLNNLPQSQHISTATGLQNALNNTGILAESQLLKLSQQQLNLPRPLNDANAIFQQLQKASALAFNKPAQQDKSAAGTLENSPVSLSQRVKNTAKLISDSSQQALANLNKSFTTASHQSIPTQTSAVGIDWQSPLFNSQQYTTLEGLLKDPLLQNPSSNNKLALAQIIGLGTNKHTSFNSQQPPPNIPLNWPDRVGNDATLLRTLQNLLGQIEREQIQQMQSNEGAQISSANAQANPQAPQQHWLPLLVLHQQQLQLIEFIIDKEEVESTQGEKKLQWFINLHFELPVLGKMSIEIAMLDNECSTTFWSESKTALSQISQHIQPLRERLTEQGILVNDIQSRYGTLAKRKINIEQRLVDITT